MIDGGANGAAELATRHDDDRTGRGIEPGGNGGRGSVPAAAVSDGLLSAIERAARDPSVDIDKFERIVAMRERLEAKDAIRAFNSALSLARGEIPPILKNRTVDYTSQKGRTSYRHEDLAEISRTVDPILKRHGLSYRWRSSQDGQKLSVTCILSHADGYSEDTTLTSSEDHTGNKNAIQAIGSAATFLQRYTLKLALGLAATVDDDGRSSSGPQTISAEQVTELEVMIDATDTETTAVLAHVNKQRLEDLTPGDYQRVKAGLVAKQRKALAK